MSWTDRLCIGKPDIGCENYRGAPCDCFGPWTAAELADARALLAAATAAPRCTCHPRYFTLNYIDPRCPAHTPAGGPGATDTGPDRTGSPHGRDGAGTPPAEPPTAAGGPDTHEWLGSDR